MCLQAPESWVSVTLGFVMAVNMFLVLWASERAVPLSNQASLSDVRACGTNSCGPETV